MQRFNIGDKVRRTGREHLGIKRGDIATVTGFFDEDGYILNHQKYGSHRVYNLEPVRPDELRAACLRTGRPIKTPTIDFTEN